MTELSAPGPESAEYIETLGWDTLDHRPLPFDDTGDIGDTGWFGSSIAHGLSNAVRSVGRSVGSVAKRASKIASGAVNLVKKGLPAVAHLVAAPAMLAKTISSSGFTAMRALASGHPGDALHALRAGEAELTSNPLWSIAQGGAALIPGVGQAVAPAMAAAAALGRGESLKDIAIDAARSAIPGGPLTQAAFDTAVGVAKGGSLSDAAVGALRERIPGGAAAKAAFDAGMALAHRKVLDPDMASVIRDAVPPDALHIYDAALGAANDAVPDDEDTGGFTPATPDPAARTVAKILHRHPHHWHHSPRQISEEFQLPVQSAQRGIAALLHHWAPDTHPEWQDVGALESTHTVADRLRIPVANRLGHGQRRPRVRVRTIKIPQMKVGRDLLLRLSQHGSTHMRKGMHRYGMLAKTARDTGELTSPTVWTIRSGDIPYMVSQKLTGSSTRWKELPAVNPGMSVQTINGATQLVPWNVGQALNIPPSWVGAPASPPATPPGAPPAPPVAPPVPPPPTTTGGPPFPPPSLYPKGYPSSTYTAQAGDLGSTIALKITGNAGRWKELVAMNPSTASAQYGMAFATGDTLKLPPSWVAAPAVVAPPIAPPPHVAPPTTTTVLPALPPDVTKVEGTQAQVMLIAGELSTFLGKHTEARFPLSPAFGQDPTDSDGHWTTRTQAALQTFQAWANTSGASQKFIGKNLDVDGIPDAQTLQVLQMQTAADLPAVVTTTTPGGATPTTPSSKPPPGGRPPAATPGGATSSSSSGGIIPLLAAGATLILGM